MGPVLNGKLLPVVAQARRFGCCVDAVRTSVRPGNLSCRLLLINSYLCSVHCAKRLIVNNGGNQYAPFNLTSVTWTECEMCIFYTDIVGCEQAFYVIPTKDLKLAGVQSRLYIPSPENGSSRYKTRIDYLSYLDAWDQLRPK